MRKTILIVVALLIVVSTGAGVYAWQQSKISSLQKQRAALQGQASTLQKQYANAKAASNINTSSWKQFCDPQVNLCFKYPASWTSSGGTADQFDYVSASVTNPAKTASVTYIEQLVKDGNADSEHIVSVKNMQIDGSTLELIGAYPVSSGVYSPYFTILNTDIFPNENVGKISFGGTNPRFDVGTHESISLQGAYTGKAMTTAAQAEAWFKSVDGKTVEAIMASYGAK